MSKNQKIGFSHRIKAERKRLKISQEFAGLMTGYSERTIQHWEAGTRIPHQSTQDAVIRKFESQSAEPIQP